MTSEEETPEYKKDDRPRLQCCGLLLILLVIVGGLLWGGYVNLMQSIKSKQVARQAHNIQQALEGYAKDHGGKFPTSTRDSNEAFRQLFADGLLDDEKNFYVRGCAWHAGKQTDGNIGSEETGFAEALSKNENHWAYTSGLNQKASPENTPIVMSGFTETPGIWCGDTIKKGGVWAGKYAIIADISGRERVVELDDDYRAMESVNGEQRNILDAVKLVPGAKLLNPDG